MNIGLSKTPKKPWLWIWMLGILLLAWLLNLTVGSVPIPIQEVIRILLGHSASQPTWATIILDFRLPKSFTALLAGSALAIAGLQMQTLFRNPLAEPYILGISSGASLGAALVILLTGGGGVHFLAKLGFLGDAGIILAAALGALTVFVCVTLLARQVHTITLLVLGVLVGYLVNALVSI